MPVPRSRRNLFRILALCSPLLLVCVAELGLRLVGWRYPTSFFLKITDNGQQVLLENPRFGWRFFPPSLARAPQPLRLVIPKPPGTFRVLVFGESAAMGDPEPAFGFARQLERMLQARHLEKRIEVFNVAMTAINSHVMRQIAADCTRVQGDCWVVYAGNNEVIGPYGAGTVFGRQGLPAGAVRLALLLKETALGQLAARFAARSDLPGDWQGMEMFLGQQVPREDARLRRVYENFAANLKAVARLGKSCGAKVLFTTVTVNLKDSPPFASAHRTGLTPIELEKFREAFEVGRRAEQQGRLSEALASYREAAQIDPDYAELAFRRASCELGQSDPSAARKDFMLARDLDTLRFRADQRLNETILKSAAEERIPLLDAEQKLVRLSSTNSVEGDDLFYDHVHLNFHGNYLLASLAVPEVERALTPSSASNAPPLLTESDVAKSLAFTEYEQRRVYTEMRARLQQPPFSAQSNFKERDERWRLATEALKGGAADCLPQYRDALALHPRDWMLHAHYARALEAAGDKTNAAAEWQSLTQLVPQEPDAFFALGNLALDGRDYVEAERLFREVLCRNSRSTEALNSLGLVASALGQDAQSRKYLETALRVNPRFSSARVNLGLLLARTGDTNSAVAQYRTVLRLETNNVAARVNLAHLLAAQGQAPEALALLNEAVALDPNEARAQYALGNALSAREQYAEAISHYSAAVKARPGFAEARYNLGLELARAGRIKEAIGQFAQVVKLMPDFTDAHFNYGIALAHQKRYVEAVQEFKETLRLQPHHPPAEAALQRAQLLDDQQKAQREQGQSDQITNEQ